MDYSFSDVVNVPLCSEMLRHFYTASGIPCAFCRKDGSPLASAGGQMLCHHFHRTHPEYRKYCEASWEEIGGAIENGAEEYLHRCENGLMDGAVPIRVEGELLGYVVIGQFFLVPPDKTAFLDRARANHLDEAAYEEALRTVPIISRERADAALRHFRILANLIAEAGAHRRQMAFLNASLQNANALLGTQITERVKAEEALRRSEERGQFALEGSDLGVWDWNLLTNDVYFSPRWLEMLGYGPGEIRERFSEWYDRVHPEDREHAVKETQRHIRGEISFYEARHRLRCKDGSYKWILARGKIMSRNAEGKPLRIVGTHRDITEQVQVEENLRHAGTHDPLTGLPNRTLFNDHLLLAMAQARRNKTVVAVIFLDLDDFKEINDTLGHDVGDLLLKAVSKRLKKEVREVDTVARMGGDEFTLILPELHGRKDAEQVAERIRGAIARPYSLGDRVLEVSASLGVSLYPLDGRDVRTLMKRADMAMYRAKNDGRNLWRFWEENTETPRK